MRCSRVTLAHVFFHSNRSLATLQAIAVRIFGKTRYFNANHHANITKFSHIVNARLLYYEHQVKPKRGGQKMKQKVLAVLIIVSLLAGLAASFVLVAAQPTGGNAVQIAGYPFPDPPGNGAPGSGGDPGIAPGPRGGS
jgi:hypothetical protein